MKKQIWKRVLSLVMSLALIAGMIQGIALEANAAETNTTFYLYCSTCKQNIGARARINGTEYNTGDYVTVSTNSPNKVEIISADGNHVLETITWNHSENNGVFRPPIYHKTDVTVRVKDYAGNPVSNRTVTTNWNNIGGVTDHNGEFKLSTRSIWYLNVTVSDPNGNITKEQRASDNGGVIEITIPNRRSVTVYLKSSAGQILKGDARVFDASGVALSKTSDGVYNGVFLVGNTYRVNVSGIPGYNDASADFTITDSTNSVDLEVELLEPKVTEGTYVVSTEVSSISLKVGETKKNYSISMFDNVNGYELLSRVNGPGGSYTWETTDSSIFEIGDDGSYKSIIGKTAGTANLKVTVNSGGVSKTKIIPVTVTKEDPNAEVTAPASVVYDDYNGNFTFRSNVAGTFDINGKSIPVSANTDVTKKMTDIISGNPEVNSYNLAWTFTPSETNKYNVKNGTVSYSVGAKDITNAGDVTFADKTFVYDGSAHKADDIKVTLGDKVLTENTDYTVSYENNVNAGKAAVVVTGKSNYTGTIRKEFEIQKAALSVENVTAKSREYDGTKVVEITGVSLNNLASSDNAADVIDWTNAAAEIVFKNAGTYEKVSHVTGIQLKDTNNYTFTQPAADNELPLANGGVTISEKNVSIENVVIAKSKIYDGTVSADILDKGTLSANYDGEDLYIVKGTASYEDKIAGKDKTVLFEGFRLEGLAAQNYMLTDQPAPQTAEIIRKPLHLVEDSEKVKDKYYDGSNVTEFVTTPKLALDDIIDGDDVSLDHSAAPTFEDVGSPDEEKVTAVDTNLSLSGIDAVNYDLQIPEVTAVIKNYIAEKDIDYKVNSSDWLNQDFEIIAMDGCLVAEDLNSSWQQNLTVSCTDNASETGTKTFYVKYPDGKISRMAEEAYKIDKIAPTGTITFTDAENTWDTVVPSPVFELFCKDAQEVMITAEDQEGLSGLAAIEWYESLDGGLSLEQLKSIDEWKAYEGNLVVTLKDAKKFVYYVKITDVAGNVTYLSTDGAVYDTTEPAIAGVINAEIYYTSQQVQVSDTNLKEVTLNGVPVVISDGIAEPITLTGNVDAVYTIIAADKAGNETKVVVTMKTIASLDDSIAALPDTVKPDDLDTVSKIEDYKAAYDSLTEDEKALISEENKSKF